MDAEAVVGEGSLRNYLNPLGVREGALEESMRVWESTR